jgi:hypothetical protein
MFDLMWHSLAPLSPHTSAPQLKPSPAAKKAARFFGQSAVGAPPWALDACQQMYFEALEDRRGARKPALYDTLAVAGLHPSQLYLRFGRVPANERSMRTGPEGPFEGPFGSPGRLEDGVSVFEARITWEGHCLLDLDNWFQCLFTLLMAESRRSAYLLWGDVVGRGLGGEPLLRNITWTQPLHPASLVATKTPSRIVEDWNTRRQGRS